MEKKIIIVGDGSKVLSKEIIEKLIKEGKPVVIMAKELEE